MPRIKIENLPQDATISKEEMKRIKGGAQVDMFLKIGTEKGESVVDKPTDIDDLSFNLSISGLGSTTST